MGLTAHWLAVKGWPESLAGTGLEHDEAFDGWSVSNLGGFVEWGELDEIAVRAAGQAGTAAVGAWTFDSDVGYIVAADRDGVVSRLVVNAEGAQSYGVSVPAKTDRDVERLVEWSRAHAPIAVDADVVSDLLSRRWTLAEEAWRAGALAPARLGAARR